MAAAFDCGQPRGAAPPAELPDVEIIVSGIVADLALGLSEYSRLSRLKLRC